MSDELTRVILSLFGQPGSSPPPRSNAAPISPRAVITGEDHGDLIEFLCDTGGLHAGVAGWILEQDVSADAMVVLIAACIRTEKNTGSGSYTPHR